MLGTPHLTQATVEQAQTAPGMAHWAGSGPPGNACKQCRFKDYWAQQRNRHGLGKDAKSRGCKKFFDLTGVHGPAIRDNLPACKYFEEKPAK